MANWNQFHGGVFVDRGGLVHATEDLDRSDRHHVNVPSINFAWIRY
ncbi:hypothetical protein [Sporisorium scitamineum]|uniref:Uncharacterized protein n=1 Tax=Sporisorium scitamineum TaxID=49012 RepID=A0A0F7SD90_9BASI|nr:hypothetical protein [Sporisorium scitamineum]